MLQHDQQVGQADDLFLYYEMMTDPQCQLAVLDIYMSAGVIREKEEGVTGGRTFPSSSTVSRPESSPCSSPDTSSTHWYSSRKNSEGPRRATADERAGPPREGLVGSGKWEYDASVKVSRREMRHVASDKLRSRSRDHSLTVEMCEAVKRRV